MSRRESDELGSGKGGACPEAESNGVDGPGGGSSVGTTEGAGERRAYRGLRGHQWWGFADETLGWTLAHAAAARDKVSDYF